MLGANLIFAQNTTGRISGTITDQNGAIVQGASVKVVNSDTNLSRETTSGEDGSFAFQLLPPGKYKVSATATNFKPTEVEAIVNITQTTTVNITLGISGGETVVTVEPSGLFPISTFAQVTTAIEPSAAVRLFVSAKL